MLFFMTDLNKIMSGLNNFFFLHLFFSFIFFQVFYPVAQFYNEGFLVTDKEITRKEQFKLYFNGQF